MLHMVKQAFTYKLSAGALEELLARGVPPRVVEGLHALKDDRFQSKRALAQALPRVISPAEAATYERHVVAAARVLRPARIARIGASVWRTYVAPASRLLMSWRAYLLLRPLAFTLRFRGRSWLFGMKRRFSSGRALAGGANANPAGFEHNRKQVMSFLEGHRNRTESIINILRSIQGFDFAGSRVLCVGPRNEAEVLLLDLYGFPLRNVTAIDLFSYSPHILLMDMNELDFPEDRFDIYYSSAVIKYSPDIRRTVAESIRVTRPGGLMVFGFMFGMESDIIPKGSELAGGVRELLALYEGHVDYVYWQEEWMCRPDDIRASVIFRLKK